MSKAFIFTNVCFLLFAATSCLQQQDEYFTLLKKEAKAGDGFAQNDLGYYYLENQNYEEAIKYLKKYKGKDDILAARALSCLGDAYVGTGDLNAALASYDKAIKKADNMFAAAYMLKAGLVCEELGNNAKALEYYQEIKDQYPQSLEAYDIDKYIARINQ